MEHLAKIKLYPKIKTEQSLSSHHYYLIGMIWLIEDLTIVTVMHI